jgi:hypothetical protein
MEIKPDPSPDEEKRVTWRLASGQGDLIYSVILIALLIAILRTLL